MSDKITYGEMMQVIADDWNKEGKDQITGQEVWDALVSCLCGWYVRF